MPAAHATQAVVALVSLSKRPAAQSEHAVEPAAAYCPLEQDEHCVLELLSPSCFPAAHGVHSVEPALAPEYLPAVQFAHAVAASLSTSAVPTGHVVQPVEAFGAYFPGLHCTHVRNMPATGAHLPASQSLQAVLAAMSWSYLPAGHLTQLLPLMYCPKVQDCAAAQWSRPPSRQAPALSSSTSAAGCRAPRARHPRAVLSSVRGAMDASIYYMAPRARAAV